VQKYHCPRFLVEFDIKVLVQLFNPLLLHPLLRICELADGSIDVEFSGSKVPSVSVSIDQRIMLGVPHTIVFHRRG